MISLLIASSVAAEPLIRYDRVDILAADPGTFVNHDLPMMGVAGTQGAIRFVEQISVVWSTPVDDLYIGTSLASQSVVYELNLHDVSDLPDFTFAYGGVQTALLLPRGLLLGGGARFGPLRVSGGLSVLSGATWRRPAYGKWQVYPTLSVGLGRKHE